MVQAHDPGGGVEKEEHRKGQAEWISCGSRQQQEHLQRASAGANSIQAMFRAMGWSNALRSTSSSFAFFIVDADSNDGVVVCVALAVQPYLTKYD